MSFAGVLGDLDIDHTVYMFYFSCSEERQEKEDDDSLSNVAHANCSLCLRSRSVTQIGNVHSHIQPITLCQRVFF